MADKVLSFAGDSILRELAGLKLHDNGDGTYSVQTTAAGGSGAVTITDGADVALGAKNDAPVVYGDATAVALLKGLGVAVGGAAVAPNDAADLAFVARSLYVGGTGDVKVTAANGDVLTLAAVPGGSVLPVAVKRVWATGTTATSLVALK